MDGVVVGEFQNLRGKLPPLAHKRILERRAAPRKRIALEQELLYGTVSGQGGGEFLYFRFADSQRLARCAQRAARLERRDSAEHRRAVFAVLLQDVVYHIVAVAPGKIDIEIRRGAAFGIEEALEEQVQLY